MRGKGEGEEGWRRGRIEERNREEQKRRGKDRRGREWVKQKRDEWKEAAHPTWFCGNLRVHSLPNCVSEVVYCLSTATHSSAHICFVRTCLRTVSPTHLHQLQHYLGGGRPCARHMTVT